VIFHNHLWQSEQWEKFQNARGHFTFRIQGVLGIERVTAIGKKFFEIPRAEISLLKYTFWEELSRKAHERKTVFSRVFPADTALDEPLPIKIHTRYVPEIFPEHTLAIDLRKPEEEILSQMKQKGRYNVNLARKKDVQIVRSTDTDTFYSLLRQTTRRDGFSPHPKEVYKNMLESFGEDGFLLLAKYTDQVIAGGIFLISDDVMTYYYGASSDEHRNVMAPYLLQWTAMQMGRQRGCGWYDFLGIAPENSHGHRLTGVSSFKEKFGGVRITYAPAFEVVHNNKWYTMLQILKKIKKPF
jgi:lipid II:glycine glycyltransferase (peptidoglycan interpeptide bridge formation enzyme)